MREQQDVNCPRSAAIGASMSYCVILLSRMRFIAISTPSPLTTTNSLRGGRRPTAASE
jgi:hypothetical protein